VLGEPVDEGATSRRRRALADPPRGAEVHALEPKTEIFETGIKVIDLIAPYVKGGKTGCSAAPVSARPSSSWS
jgi:F-type H+/Na+-transporting ATPase subunit beta